MKSANVIFLLVIGTVFSAIVWINVTEIEAIIRGEGEVSPEANVQLVQPRFSGRIAKLHVSVGDEVKTNDVVAELNNLDASSQLEENLSTIDVLMAEITRLKAEVNLQDTIDWQLNLPESLMDVQNALFFVRKEKRKQESEVLFQEIRLAESKRSELKERMDGLKKLFKLKDEEKSI